MLETARPPLALAALVFLASLTTAPAGAGDPSFDLARADVVDLTHAFDSDTIYWPTSTTRFALERLHRGPTPGGFFYAANALSTPEHGGTHLDAPIHFGEGKRDTAAVPLAQLVRPAVVIDVADKARADADYRLTPADLAAWEKAHGAIPEGAIVLLRTGWSTRWPDRKAYLGDDKPGDASNLHFPSYGAEAAAILVKERKVSALGVDTASIDHGPSKDFPVHRLAAAAEVPGLENLDALDRLPATGAWIAALPMKIADGSGGPLRAAAFVPRR